MTAIYEQPVIYYFFSTAMQRRAVKCEIGGNLTVDPYQCEENERPIDRQECYNEKCVGKWKVGPWSEVLQIIINYI